MITVIGAGSGKAENLSLEAYRTIKSADLVILKTEKMPIVKLLKDENISYETLDDIYDTAEDFDSLNEAIKARLTEKENCVYVVHGSAIDDTSVSNIENVKIIPGISVADCAAAYMNVVTDVKAYTTTEIFNGEAPSLHQDNIITCIDSTLIAGDLKCILAQTYGDEFKIKYYTEDYLGNQFSKEIFLYELDMQEIYNHTTSIFLEKVDFNNVYRYDIKHLLNIMDKLCARNGCPWDSVQTHQSLRSYLIEEAYEVADTIDKDDPYRLYDELGDVLYQVVFHANIGARYGEFDFTDITDSISRKMINRHPQIFQGADINENTNDFWEERKNQEKGLNSTYDVMCDVPEGLASLARAEKILHKAEKAGIKHDDARKTIDSIKSILQNNNLKSEDVLGELLFEIVKLCRALNVHPELALNKKTKKYINNFKKK